MCNVLRPKLFVAMLSVLGLFGSAAYAQVTLNEILARGSINCGVNSNNLPGFSEMGEGGEFSGFDVDYCRALAAAVFGNKKNTVNFVPLTSANRFTALRDRDIDVLIRVTTQTLSRDSATDNGGEGANFAPTIFYDGQGFMTNVTNTDIFNVDDLVSFLSGNIVCVEPNTTTADNLAALGTGFSILEVQDIYTEYDNGFCNVATSDKSALAAGRTTLANPANSSIFSVTISKEPLGPVVLHGDDEWYDVVRWVVYATFFAEEHGITKSNVKSFTPSDPEEERFLGKTGGLGAKLGLSRHWARDVIKAVGNYKDIYDANLTAILPRERLNKQYVDGGLLYAPPFN